MNRTELVNSVAEISGLTKADSKKAVDAVFESITKSLAKGEGVAVLGFGNFDVSERPAREGRNPLTGEKITIAAKKQPKFKAGKALKDAVEG